MMHKQIKKSLGYVNLMTGLNTVYKLDEYEIGIFEVFENDEYDNFSLYITIYKEHHIILTISDTGPRDMRQHGPGGSLIIEIEAPDPWHKKEKDGREYGWLSYQPDVDEDTKKLLGIFSYGSRLDNIVASLEILKTYLLDESAPPKNEHSTFGDNILCVGDKKIEFQRDIWKTIEDEQRIYVLLKFPMARVDYDNTELHNIYAYSFDGELLWQVGNKLAENGWPYIHFRSDDDGIFVIDYDGKRYIINKSTGVVTDFEHKA